MRIFKKREEHSSLDTLSEYLDGRLSATNSQRVARHVELCSGCSEESSSLELTVGLLRRAPMVAPRRSFTLREEPAITPARTAIRAPSWAYGAAASVAVVLFALVLSADLSGTLSRDVSAPDETRPAAPAEPVPQPVLEVEVTRVIEKEVEVVREVEKMAVESEVALQETVRSQQIAAAAVEVEAPAAAQSSAEVPEDAIISAPAPQALPPAPETAELEQEGLPGPTPDSPEKFEVLSPPGGRDEGTAIVRRVLEGVFGGVALALVAAILWRIRRLRRPATS